MSFFADRTNDLRQEGTLPELPALGANRPFVAPAETETALKAVADFYAGVDPDELAAYLSGCDHQVAAYEAQQAEKLAAAKRAEFLEDHLDDWEAERTEFGR